MLSCDFSMLVLLALFCINFFVIFLLIYLYFVGFIVYGFTLKLVKIFSKQRILQLAYK